MYNPHMMLRRLMGVDIIKVFSLNAISTLVRMLAGMISVKVIAVIIGPVGIALLGQLNNFNSILLGLANGGINSGITKYVAEYKDDVQTVKLYTSNALRIILSCTGIVALVLIFGCRWLSKLVLLSDEYYYVFIVFGFTIVLYTLNGLLLSILNGYKQFRKYVIVNICGTILGLIYSVTLVSFFGLQGALINAVTFQSVVFFITLWMCRKELWCSMFFFEENVDPAVVKKYLGYSLMTLTTLMLLPVSQMLLRGYVISEISASEAGIWEGMNQISSMYLNVITTSFIIYYLPRLSEITNNCELRKEIFRCYKVFVPILLVICVSIFLLRHFILWLLFSPEFYPMENLFPWQLIGDFFKISSWMLAYIMVAKARTKSYIATEVFFTFAYIVLCFVFLRYNGIVGLVQGYLCVYILYLISMIYLFKNIIFQSDNGYPPNYKSS